jgi:hypothetical protein
MRPVFFVAAGLRIARSFSVRGARIPREFFFRFAAPHIFLRRNSLTVLYGLIDSPCVASSEALELPRLDRAPATAVSLPPGLG